MAIRVAIVEDDGFTRASLSAALESQDLLVVATASHASEALEIISAHSLDAVILDIDLGSGPTGLDLADILSKQQPHLGIVMLTSSPDPRLVRASLPQVPPHAVYLVKSSMTDISTLMAAISEACENVRSGKVSSNSSEFDQLILTDIQIETLRYVAEGLSNHEIAKQRFVSEKAVEQTISKIAKTMGIDQTSSSNQRVHIARMYFRMRGQG